MAKECFDFAQAISNQRPQLAVVRSHFERRVDQEATAPFPVAQGTFDDLLDEPTDGLLRGQRVSKSLDPRPRRVIEVTLQCSNKKRPLVAKGVIKARTRNSHRVGKIAHRCGFVAAMPKASDCGVQCGRFVKFPRPSHFQFLTTRLIESKCSLTLCVDRYKMSRNLASLELAPADERRAMGVLIDGIWRDGELPQETGSSGEFRRADSRFRDRVTADGSSGFKAEPDRYHLYVAHGCPWAHRIPDLSRAEKAGRLDPGCLCDPRPEAERLDLRKRSPISGLYSRPCERFSLSVRGLHRHGQELYRQGYGADAVGQEN